MSLDVAQSKICYFSSKTEASKSDGTCHIIEYEELPIKDYNNNISPVKPNSTTQVRFYFLFFIFFRIS